jgi:hypothetical protein
VTCCARRGRIWLRSRSLLTYPLSTTFGASHSRATANPAAAGAEFKDGNPRWPHWADPLSAWGDVLAEQGHRKEVLVKYDAALKHAPNCKHLKVTREVLMNRKA